MPDAELEPGRPPVGQVAQPVDELDELPRRREGRVIGRRDAFHAGRNAPDLGDLLGYLRRRHDAAEARLGALGQLHADTFHRIDVHLVLEHLRVETAVRGPAAEIAAGDLPYQIAAVLQVVGRQAALARVVGEAAQLGPQVQGPNGVGADRAEAHGRDVEKRHRVGALAPRSADGNPKMRLGRRHRHRGMQEILVAGGIDVTFRSERLLCMQVLGPLVDQGPLLVVEGRAVDVAFDEVLPNLRADALEDPAQPGGDRIVAHEVVLGLQEVVDAEAR